MVSDAPHFATCGQYPATCGSMIARSLFAVPKLIFQQAGSREALDQQCDFLVDYLRSTRTMPAASLRR